MSCSVVHAIFMLQLYRYLAGLTLLLSLRGDVIPASP